jgi:hypothetical protein
MRGPKGRNEQDARGKLARIFAPYASEQPTSMLRLLARRACLSPHWRQRDVNVRFVEENEVIKGALS